LHLKSVGNQTDGSQPPPPLPLSQQGGLTLDSFRGLGGTPATRRVPGPWLAAQEHRTDLSIGRDSPHRGTHGYVQPGPPSPPGRPNPLPPQEGGSDCYWAGFPSDRLRRGGGYGLVKTGATNTHVCPLAAAPLWLPLPPPKALPWSAADGGRGKWGVDPITTRPPWLNKAHSIEGRRMKPHCSRDMGGGPRR